MYMISYNSLIMYLKEIYTSAFILSKKFYSNYTYTVLRLNRVIAYNLKWNVYSMNKTNEKRMFWCINYYKYESAKLTMILFLHIRNRTQLILYFR